MNAPKSIHFVVATPDSEESFKENSPFYKYWSHLKIDATLHIIANNTEGLSTCYNKFIAPEYRNCLVVFVHDDVEIHDAFTVEKLRAAHQQYDIVGLAGGDGVNNNPPFLWHIMSKNRSGTVAHVTHPPRITSVCFGPSPSEVALLDGLFLSVDIDSLLSHNVTFDETFKFHFYDLAFCRRATKAGLTLSTCNIFVVHHGTGASANTPEWAASQIKYASIY